MTFRGKQFVVVVGCVLLSGIILNQIFSTMLQEPAMLHVRHSGGTIINKTLFQNFTEMHSLQVLLPAAEVNITDREITNPYKPVITNQEIRNSSATNTRQFTKNFINYENVKKNNMNMPEIILTNKSSGNKNSGSFSQDINGVKYQQKNISASSTNVTSNQSNDSVHPTSSDVIVITGLVSDWVLPDKANLSFCKNLSPEEKCQFVSKTSTNSLNKSDAVIFRPFEMRHTRKYSLKHPAHQKWVFFEWESPSRSWTNENMDQDFWAEINVTVSYMQDSDLIYYGYGVKCQPDTTWAPSKRNYAREKTKGVLWLVGNCHHTSGREHYVTELQKYIDVDIYGGCGQGIVCGRYGSHNYTCLSEFIKQYKFYLSFENSFCEGYYTEKFTRLLNLPVIPVVMGLFNYTTLIPTGSYINVHDFTSPQSLAKHLKYLSHNDKEYNMYIEKKRMVKCDKQENYPFICKLCQYLHQHKGQIQEGKDARHFFGTNEKCISMKELTGFQTG